MITVKFTVNIERQTCGLKIEEKKTRTYMYNNQCEKHRELKMSYTNHIKNQGVNSVEYINILCTGS
jgi:uncharacterized protein YebE (UPF0316 family)